MAAEYEKFEEAKKRLLAHYDAGGMRVLENEIVERRKAITVRLQTFCWFVIFIRDQVQKNIVLLQSVVRRWLARKKLTDLRKYNTIEFAL